MPDKVIKKKNLMDAPDLLINCSGETDHSTPTEGINWARGVNSSYLHNRLRLTVILNFEVKGLKSLRRFMKLFPPPRRQQVTFKKRFCHRLNGIHYYCKTTLTTNCMIISS